jgi:hypothetical protein
MSDTSIDNSAPAAGGDVPAPSSDSSSTPVADSGSDNVPDFDKMFGLEPDPGQSAVDAKSDVPPATNEPANRQGETVAKPEGDPTKDVPAADAASEEGKAPTDSQKTATLEASEKLNWSTAPESFRQAHEDLKKEFLTLAGSSIEQQYLSSPTDFVKWMEETSPTSYEEIGGHLATVSANLHPQKWADYLLKENPQVDLDGKPVSLTDYIAQQISGRPEMTAERLRGELSVALDDDDPDLKKAVESDKAKTAEKDANKPKDETPEQKEIREWREEKVREKRAAATNEIFTPVISSVNDLVSQAGLEIKDSDIAGKKFADLDPDMKFKVSVNNLLPAWIDQQVASDPVLLNLQGRMEEVLSKNPPDVKTAMQLQHRAKIAIENITTDFLSFMTATRASAKKSEIESPSKDTPPPIVKGAGAGNPAAPALTDPLTKDDWAMTEADLPPRRR